MKCFIVIVSFTITGWAAPANSQIVEPKVDPDVKYSIAQEIEQGAPTKTTGIEASTVLGKVPLENFFEGLGIRV